MLNSNTLSSGLWTSAFDGSLYTCMHYLESLERLVVGTGNGSLRWIFFVTPSLADVENSFILMQLTFKKIYSTAQVYWCFPRSKASSLEGWICWFFFSFPCLCHMLMWIWQNTSRWSSCSTILGCSWTKFWSLQVIRFEKWKCYCLLEGSWWICDKGMIKLPKKEISFEAVFFLLSMHAVGCTGGLFACFQFSWQDLASLGLEKVVSNFLVYIFWMLLNPSWKLHL